MQNDIKENFRHNRWDILCIQMWNSLPILKEKFGSFNGMHLRISGNEYSAIMNILCDYLPIYLKMIFMIKILL